VELAKKLEGYRAVLMKNHGSTVVAESVETATLYAIFLEKACRIQLIAAAAGDPTWSNDEEAREKYEQIYTPHRLGSMWDYFVRRAKRLAID
jgi:ribulose-5-phosphate 4-epimerase/fuculose-1-phosphate aldolase